MKLLPQIRLRTFFVVFFCAAIGMTCATAPEPADDPNLGIINLYIARLNLHYALLTAAAMAMVIGLLQQVRMIVRLKMLAATNQNGLKFARKFAISWRVAIAATIFGCLLFHILILRKVIQPIDHEDHFIVSLAPGTLLDISVIVVLIDCVRRWQRAKPARYRTWIEPLAWIFGLAFALIVLPDSGLIMYLVHIAIEGIERAAPLRFHRPDVFPNHELEHFQTFWMSFGTVIIVVLALYILAFVRPAKLTTKRFAAIAVVYLTLIGISGAYCIWFYNVLFPRLSPDMASVGFASNWLDWLAGSAIVSIFTCAAAYRLAVCTGAEPTIELEINHESDEPVLHESMLCLVTLFGAALIYFVETIREFWTPSGFFGASSFWEAIATLLGYTQSYPMLAIAVLSLQLCWIHWRRRHDAMTWELHPLDRRRFVVNWLALGLLAAVALPTFSIYCFTFWVGPWYLYGPK
jgi:hypothetical protein